MIMGRGRYTAYLGSIWALLALLLSLGFGHMVMTANAMPDMTGGKSSVNQCQSSCGSSLPIGLSGVKQEVNQDKDPVPLEPYYLAFMGVGWTTVVAVAAAYLLRYLRWRPPDLLSLNCVYRI
jgi:hypothetical protein